MKTPKYVLETDRLRLREFEPADAENVREMLADDYAREIFRDVIALSEFPQGWVERNQKRYREDGFGLWAMETKASGEFAGDCERADFERAGSER